MAIILLSEDDEDQVHGEGYTADISEHGARVQTNMSLRVGQIVDLSPSDTPEYAARGRVVWIGTPASDQRGEAGIAFMVPLPAAS
jgi:hypothetical protein